MDSIWLELFAMRLSCTDDPAMTNLTDIPAVRASVVAPGEGERIWFTSGEMPIKAGAETPGGHLGRIEPTAPAGHGPPLHVHHDEHEAFYVLAGTLEVQCGDERYRAEPRTF